MNSLYILFPEPGAVVCKAPQIYGLAPPGSFIEISIDNQFSKFISVLKSGKWSYKPQIDLLLGPHELCAHLVCLNLNNEISRCNRVCTKFTLEKAETALTSVDGLKLWYDLNNQHHTRPQSITIDLLQNGRPLTSTTVSSTGDSIFSFADVPRFTPGGEEYNYTLSEPAPPVGYSASVAGNTIINVLNRLTVKVAHYNASTNALIKETLYNTYFGGGLTVYAENLPGYTPIPPQSHSFTNIRQDKTWTFYYYEWLKK